VTTAHLALLVAVLVNGALVPSAPPATVVAGHVVGPAALVAQFVDRVDLRGETLAAQRAGRRCTARSVAHGDVALVQLAPLARCLGARLSWDGRAKTLSIAFATAVTIRPLPPFDPSAPRVAPTAVFTPEPAPPTPRVIDTGPPHPRRTAIPVIPSWPLATTSPRR
jgi:hypothetical protein